MRIGVFICQCGTNIAGTVDTRAVAKKAMEFPDVVFAVDYMYTCSEPGQKEIQDAIASHRLQGVVVAACSPRMHEATFRRAVKKAGINPYMFEQANIREHCSWIGTDREANTRKAIDLVRMSVEKLRCNQALFSTQVAVNKRVLVIGGGVAGIQAALDCSDGGLEVVMVEREPSIGGKMAKLDKTFPTIDCSSCILGPKMVDVAQKENIRLYAYSEVEAISGYIGNFKVDIRKKATYVDWDACTGCGECTQKCPSKKAFDYFNEGLGTTTAINIPFPQAIPKKARIDSDYCRYLTGGKCRVCEKICPVKAIRFDMKDEIVTEEVGAIIVASGYDLFDARVYGEYGGGRYPDVISAMQYERILSASGPYGGHIRRPSDGREPKEIVFISCVGSRDISVDRPYCSGVCCMYIAKQAIMTRDHIPDSNCYVSYMDIRAPGKGYDEFIRRAQEEYGVKYIRGRVGRIYPRGDRLVVQGADTLLGVQVEIEADLVVLATGVECSAGARPLAEKLRISYDQHGFYMESHPKLRPVETNTAGVFLAGVCQGPKDIPASVGQGSAAASKVQALFSRDTIETDPQVAHVNENMCIGCGKCEQVCPFGAIRMKTLRDGSRKSEVLETVCQGCGLCNATCPNKAIQLRHSTDDQILAEINTLFD
ncbi:MAG: CoB--CoM heterodisulfide reductase iron-sulfur subunit A family protein [Desulfobacterales bacterium]|jgi:heterodisulfide reductase subunit A|nr:CoB--CoM heterodisulfide reductase iron-sulfur subunit A family protein [Desulfobacterales bacterium]MDD3081678.1 CoB--CoM heterodisulfide reductase iron-sulfur subunit A family protein [Desulfobacterales bacterium]MDD3950655.1 CoB--CoM heterodisulfide reductase iron-sulfur subunit A family protein [Desulfobacterales bacterium]MDD4462738.1 CoB--CoM heterodisulfide reductase iron-sulfur subunit A family protein [Desulfobacterales bacterium]MDY0377003.1 CoB--CoM heterodisulfide reductase iron-